MASSPSLLLFVESTDNFWPPHSRNGIISAINLLANSHYIDLKTMLLEECESCSNKKTADGQTEEVIQGRPRPSPGDVVMVNFLRRRIIPWLTWSARRTAPQRQKQQNHLKVWFSKPWINYEDFSLKRLPMIHDLTNDNEISENSIVGSLTLIKGSPSFSLISEVPR